MDTPHETASECYNMSRRRSGRREVGIGIGHHRVGIGIGRHEVGIGIGKIYFSATIPFGPPLGGALRRRKSRARPKNKF